MRGWNLIPQWKTSKSAPIRPGWLQAILAGHTEIAKGLQLTCPTLVWASVGSFGGKWNLLARRRDAVLDADKVAATAHKLSTNVTLRRFESLHDVILSDPDVRQSAWASFHAWLPMALPQAANIRRGGLHPDLPLAGLGFAVNLLIYLEDCFGQRRAFRVA